MSECFVNVILPLPLEGAFTYRVPASLNRGELPGSRVRVPFSGRFLTGVVTEVTSSAPEARILDVAELPDPGPALSDELMQLTRWLASYYACSWGEAARAALPPDGSPRRQLFVKKVPGAEVPEGLGSRQTEVLNHIDARNGLPEAASAVIEATGASHATLRSLEKRGLVSLSEDVASVPAAELARPMGLDQFHPSQRMAAETLREAIDRADFKAFLLHGVTGSGKTEVYIDALVRAVESGRTGIVLVPEISLTPQTVRRFRRHFGSRVAVLHSRLSSGNRADTSRRIAAGEFDVVIGPRSAVFAPLNNIGLIVVDEEHEASYKQFDPAPRYNARDVAVVRASRVGAVCVLGSATPSLESYHNARSGKYVLLHMPDRVPLHGGGRAKLPRVRVIDLLADRSAGSRPIISRALKTAIGKRLEANEQVILLQNRRGFAPVLSCDRCGAVPECPDCSVSLTWHKAHRQMRCHYCGRAFRAASECSSCENGHLEPVGTGTQRVEEELADLFPSARVLRMDLDTTGRKDSHDRILNAFGAGEADMLVGTQMVAKGLDFGRVTLVGVVDADAGLLFPDFRSDERTFQLLTQVAGRAGRADLPGEVIFQTRNSRHPVIQLARRHDYLGFATRALETRKALNYPPFSRAVRIEVQGPDQAEVARLAERFGRAFSALRKDFALVGPAPAFIERVRRSWRYLALAKLPRSLPAELMKEGLHRAVAASGRLPKGYRINIDVDPMGML